MDMLNQKHLDLLFNYIKERHMIYKQKEIQKLVPPWTEDPILQKYKFTNVFRTLDPGTRYVLDFIFPQLKATSAYLGDVLFNLIIYRMFNKVQTFQIIGIQHLRTYSRENIEMPLRKIQENGESIFTNAFTVSGYSFVSFEKDKLARVSYLLSKIHKLVPQISEEIEIRKDSDTTYRLLKSLPGIGLFLAYQIAVDLGYWNSEYYDESIHVVAGPGCRAGINWIFTNRHNMTYEECIEYLVNIQAKKFQELGVDPKVLFEDQDDDQLNLMAMENCLCEISKYLKAFYNTGRPRNRYYIGQP